MKLREWLYQRRIKIKDFAIMMGFSKSYVHGWLSGRKSPSKKTLRRIQIMTDGQVMDMGDLQDD